MYVLYHAFFRLQVLFPYHRLVNIDQTSLRLEASDEELSCTQLMHTLPAQGITVAQFDQAIGAMYYAALPR